jgi:hypothetical protein
MPVESLPAQELEFCGPTVLVEELVQKPRIHKNGLATGQLKVRFINLGTGVVVDANASGPGRGSGTEAGDVASSTFQSTGRNVVFPVTAGEGAAFRAAGLP